MRRRATWAGALALAATIAAAACGRGDGRPEAECLVVTADSTYWVTVRDGHVKFRGVPMYVARVAGSFREFYVVDDDRSYPEAVLVGYRLYARDIERGDSVLLHGDTIIPRLAREYAVRHPDAAPLAPDEPERDDAPTRATAEVELLSVHGPYLSIEQHDDVDLRDGRVSAHAHGYRRTVLDVRNGAPVTIADLFGAKDAPGVLARGRDAWAAARDSAARVPGEDGKRARAALAGFGFDATSFAIVAAGVGPAVEFAIPGRSTEAGVQPVELAPVPVAAPAWWREVAADLPLESGNQLAWVRGADTLTATVDRDAGTWGLALRQGTRAPRGVTRLSSTPERVIWLDSAVSARARSALERAFAEAAEYEGGGQVALAPRSTPVIPASVALPFGHGQDARGASRQLLAVRVVGADDAAGRERARPRVRWRAAGDARQDGGRLRDAARPQALRHRLD